MAYYGNDITIKDYFEKQKQAENLCRSNICRFIKQAIILGISFVVLLLLSSYMYSSSTALKMFGILLFYFAAFAAVLFFGSFIQIRKEIKSYKFRLYRIEEYMTAGNIFVSALDEDYHKFDLIKKKKTKKYKPKNIKKMQKETDRQRIKYAEEWMKKEHEKRIEEEFNKKYNITPKDDD